MLLDDLVGRGVAGGLRERLRRRENLVVCGGDAGDRMGFLNALLAESAMRPVAGESAARRVAVLDRPGIGPVGGGVSVVGSLDRLVRVRPTTLVLAEVATANEAATLFLSAWIGVHCVSSVDAPDARAAAGRMLGFVSSGLDLGDAVRRAMATVVTVGRGGPEFGSGVDAVSAWTGAADAGCIGGFAMDEDGRPDAP